ncbi:hypothetical protein [Nocardia fluminea]|uniref:hypothetical protein n=1 Tax=Nocardia fluminea TaxID=134984 RepID=UPI00364DD811
MDANDCEFDHHGGCQMHGYLDLEPGEMCPQAEAKQWLAEQGADTTGKPRRRCSRCGEMVTLYERTLLFSNEKRWAFSDHEVIRKDTCDGSGVLTSRDDPDNPK